VIKVKQKVAKKEHQEYILFSRLHTRWDSNSNENKWDIVLCAMERERVMKEKK